MESLLASSLLKFLPDCSDACTHLDPRVCVANPTLVTVVVHYFLFFKGMATEISSIGDEFAVDDGVSE